MGVSKPTPSGFEMLNGFSYNLIINRKLWGSQECFLHLSLFLNYFPIVNILIPGVSEVEGEALP